MLTDADVERIKAGNADRTVEIVVDLLARLAGMFDRQATSAELEDARQTVILMARDGIRKVYSDLLTFRANGGTKS